MLHYSQMTWANATAVGCGATQYMTDGIWYWFLLACNYAGGNMVGATWYYNGTAGSKCSTGTNPAFPALCSTNEPLNPNYYNMP